MNVHTRLTAGFSDINANIATVGWVLFVNKALRVVHEREHRMLFFGSHVEEAGYMVLGDD